MIDFIKASKSYAWCMKINIIIILMFRKKREGYRTCGFISLISSIAVCKSPRYMASFMLTLSVMQLSSGLTSMLASSAN